MAAAIDIDALQGTLDNSVWFHMDLNRDVLYLRKQQTRSVPVFGEETAEGFTVLRTDNGTFAGMTIVNYWGRFGYGDLNHASIESVKERVADWAQRHLLSA